MKEEQSYVTTNGLVTWQGEKWQNGCPNILGSKPWVADDTYREIIWYIYIYIYIKEESWLSKPETWQIRYNLRDKRRLTTSQTSVDKHQTPGVWNTSEKEKEKEED